VLLNKLCVYLKDCLDREDYNEMYPLMLKRLDDAQDQIRIEMAKGFESFFDQINDPWSSSLYTYTVKTIFIHLDDPNKNVKDAIYRVLQKAARVQT